MSGHEREGRSDARRDLEIGLTGQLPEQVCVAVAASLVYFDRGAGSEIDLELAVRACIFPDSDWPPDALAYFRPATVRRSRKVASFAGLSARLLHRCFCL